ncbi:MAG TPA: glutathione transferase GstA [Myxococcota bacterium]|nr:glutathione transferase GstA [Myxococcota bacterium]
MKLYLSPGACSLSPHIVLREAGIPFELERVDLKTKRTESGADYYAVNPKGQVPLLKLDDGDSLTEGPAIVQYIADHSPGAKLAPAAGTKQRYHLLEWLNYVTSELHKSFGSLFAPNTPDEYKKIVEEGLEKKFEYLDRQLSGRPYLLGDGFSVADAYLFTVLNWTRVLSIDLSRHANLVAYQKRVADRPKVREALKAEGLLK